MTWEELIRLYDIMTNVKPQTANTHETALKNIKSFHNQLSNLVKSDYVAVEIFEGVSDRQENTTGRLDKEPKV